MRLFYKAKNTSSRPLGKPLNVGIIGCGMIAEHHLRFISKVEGARVVALSDTLIQNAQNLGEKYNVGKVYSSHLEMMNSTPLDIVHILTPPEFHFQQALDAIDRGLHVLLEKPCTIRSQELEELYRRSETKGVLLCPDFIQLFNPLLMNAAALIDSGELGKVIHVDSQAGVELNTEELRETMGLPWRFKLPGGILHDTITHPLYLALRWLGDFRKVSVVPRSHGILPQGLTDHMDIVLEGKESTANIVISAVIKPAQYFLHVFCERGNVSVNFDTSTVVVERNGQLPRFVRRATANFSRGYQLLSHGIRNAILFALGRLVPYQGLENLIPRFYECIRSAGKAPVSKELAIAVARAEEDIFSQSGKLHLDIRRRESTQKSIIRKDKVLVTGATGYLGSVVVRRLVQEGYYVRALVRELSHLEWLEKLGVDLVYGDIRDRRGVAEAAKGMDIAIHMAAAVRGSAGFMLDCAVKGTRHVAAAAKEHNLKRVIYLSSMSVYDALKLRGLEVITEDSPLEESPELRGTYSLAKRLAEDEALSRLRDSLPAWTILRPAVIVGGDGNVFSPLGPKLGNLLLCPGSRTKTLHLIYVRDVAAAIVESIQHAGTERRVFNLSTEGVRQGEYVDRFIRKIGYENLRVVYVPYWIGWSASSALKCLGLLSRKLPHFGKRQLASLYGSEGTNNCALETETGWYPRRDLLQVLLMNENGETLSGSLVFAENSRAES